MTWQSWSRTVRLLLPLDGCGGSFFDSGDAWGGSARDPISSTEQMPIPYALRRARLTARVSATRISAPWTRKETLEGSASPYPTNPWHVRDLYTVALNAYRRLSVSENSGIGST